MVSTSLRQLTDEVSRLRRQRGDKVHLPEALREAAAYLAASHGIRVVSRELGISRNSLRPWMKRYPVAPAPRAQRSRSKAQAAQRPEPVAFFEIKTSPAAAPGRAPEGATSTVELTRPDGLTMRVTGELAKELVAAMLEKFTTVRGGTL